MRKLFFTLLFLVLTGLGSFAQLPHTLHLQKSAGLPSNAVYNLFQDSKGYIWIANKEGLTRYDGFQYKTYKCLEQSSTAGSCIREDKLGRIWYENFDGFLYYVDSSRAEMKALMNRNYGYMPYGITQNYLFLLAKDGVSVYDIHTLQKIQKIPVDIYNPNHTANSADDFYFVNDNTLFKVGSNFKLTQIQLSEKELGLTKHLYFDLQTQKILVVCKNNENGRILRFDKNLKPTDTILSPQPKLIQGIDFNHGNYFLNSAQGTFVYDKNGRLEHTYFPDKSVSCVLIDRQNNYWFSTTNDGIYVAPNINNTSYTFGSHIPNLIVKISTQHFLIGTRKGELLLTDTHFNILKSKIVSEDLNEIYQLYYDSLHNVAAYSSKGFHLIDIESLKPTLSASYSIKEICKIDDTYMAFGASTMVGIFKHKNKPGKQLSEWDDFFQSKPHVDSNFAMLFSGVRGKSVAYDSCRKRIYYATNEGMLEFGLSHSKDIRFNDAPFYAQKIIVAEKQLFALSTNGNFYQIDSNYKFTLINPLLGIEEFNIKLVKKFDSNLIIASQRALHQLDLRNLKHIQYEINIEPNEINDVYLDNNILLVITNNGIIKTKPKESTLGQSSALFYINAVKSQSNFLDNWNEVTLNPGENEISIEYAILDYGKVLSEKLYYKINNEKWIAVSEQTRSLVFPSLSSGSYEIQFKLGNKIQQAKVSFVILPPLWRRPWFIATCLFFLAGLGYGYYQYRVSVLSKQINLLRENVELEKNLSKSILKSIKSQMNPHFFYNALNTIQAYIFTNDSENAGKYLSKFSKLTRKILEMSEEDTIQLSEEIDTLRLYLEIEQVRFDGDFEYAFELDADLDLDMIQIPPMLLQPYIENAIKHGLLHKPGEKKLKIRFHKSEQYLSVTIDDNGIGRKRSAELNAQKDQDHKSFASEANAKRLQLLNQKRDKKVVLEFIDKTDETGNASGTTVMINIPLN